MKWILPDPSAIDEGIIYEEGPTKEIFLHPKKEKTREFIEHLRTFVMEVKADDARMKGSMDKIARFCDKYDLSNRTVLRVQSLFEEIGMIALLQKGYAPMVRLKLFAGEAEMHFRLSYEGEAYNPLENLDEISGAIVRNIAECTHRYENGTNVISAGIGIQSKRGIC